jgi:hypothetical protein
MACPACDDSEMMTVVVDHFGGTEPLVDMTDVPCPCQEPLVERTMTLEAWHFYLNDLFEYFPPEDDDDAEWNRRRAWETFVHAAMDKEKVTLCIPEGFNDFIHDVQADYESERNSWW